MKPPGWVGRLAWVLPPLAALAVSHLLDRGPLSAPPPLHPSVWVEWWRQRPPLVAAFALLREALMAASWYAIGLWSLAAAAGFVPTTRRLLEACATVRLPGAARALAVAVVLTPVSAAAYTGPGTSTATPVMRYLGPESHAAMHPAAHPVDQRFWVVRPGDSLWSIAAARVPPEEVGRYWWRLVEVNRSRLPEPSDADLLYPGDVVELPPVRRGASGAANWSP